MFLIASHKIKMKSSHENLEPIKCWLFFFFQNSCRVINHLLKNNPLGTCKSLAATFLLNFNQIHTSLVNELFFCTFISWNDFLFMSSQFAVIHTSLFPLSIVFYHLWYFLITMCYKVTLSRKVWCDDWFRFNVHGRFWAKGGRVLRRGG